MSVVFVQTDANGHILGINSDSNISDVTGWVKIDEGDGDRYMHAQGNYLPKSLMDEQGRYRYKLVDGAVVERTPEELEDVPIPVVSPTAGDQLRADIDYLAMLMEVNL
jgi:hypothetical protein